MNFNYCPLTGEPFETRDSIEVIYNGTKYTLPYNGFSYGATYDEVSDEYDFSEYPLAIENDVEKVALIVPVDTPLPITISAGYTETTPTVWEKVGSGGSEPTEEGYEINNPVLTINYDNHFDVQVSDANVVSLDDDGYLSSGTTSIPVGESTLKTVVLGYNYGEYNYYYDVGIRKSYISSTSNLVNCTYDDEYGGQITITDPTKDASIDILLNHEVI